MGTALAPGNAALTRINRTLDQTQQELISLHNQLSQLPPVRPTLAATNTTLIPSPPVKEISVQTDPLLVAKKKQRRVVGAVASTANVCRAAVPYWWRIVKAALPFHLALIALLLAACVMEPSCCNYLNTFGSSLVPKLSYLGGPPPIWMMMPNNSSRKQLKSSPLFFSQPTWQFFFSCNTVSYLWSVVNRWVDVKMWIVVISSDCVCHIFFFFCVTECPRYYSRRR